VGRCGDGGQGGSRGSREALGEEVVEREEDEIIRPLRMQPSRFFNKNELRDKLKTTW
jgi:hypothetical protein